MPDNDKQETLAAPSWFPRDLWMEQRGKYRHYHRWFNGDILRVKKQVAKGVVYKFPLRVNFIKDFAFKRAKMLFGEVPENSDQPLVRTVTRPRNPLRGGKPSQDDKKFATFLQNVVNEVWLQSGGRSLQMQNGVLSQYLGGCVFRLVWDETSEYLNIPLQVEVIRPDFFFPIPNGRDPYDLLECWVAWQIPAEQAKTQFGVDAAPGTSVTYGEHWTKGIGETKGRYQVYVGEEKVKDEYGEPFDLEHDFGFIPFVYIPNKRASGYFGQSIVDDMEGVCLEYNARLADRGTAAQNSAFRKRYVWNMGQGAPTQVQLSEGTTATFLGNETPNAKNTPGIQFEDPPKDANLESITDDLFSQALKSGALPPVAYGVDEGSQRSGQTLLIRFWPLTADVSIQRHFWTDGLNRFAWMICKMLAVKQFKIEGESIPEDFGVRVNFNQEWKSFLPPDREQKTNEYVQRRAQDGMSTETFIKGFGDINDVEEEIERIDAEKQADADRAMQQMQLRADTFNNNSDKAGDSKNGASPDKKPVNQQEDKKE